MEYPSWVRWFLVGWPKSLFLNIEKREVLPNGYVASNWHFGFEGIPQVVTLRKVGGKHKFAFWPTDHANEPEYEDQATGRFIDYVASRISFV